MSQAMCGLCGIFDDGRRWLDTATLDPAAFRRERLRRLAIVRRVLAPLRVAVDDWEGASFLVRGPTGAVEIVDNLFDLWRSAERLSGQRLDPLRMNTRPHPAENAEPWSWPGLSRPSTSSSRAAKKDVDARDKPAHDGG